MYLTKLIVENKLEMQLEKGCFFTSDTTRAYWHGDMDLETIPSWHASAYLRTLLGCLGTHFKLKWVTKVPMMDIESKGVGVLDIHENAHVLAYLQASEILVGLTSRERD
jgi:hypothetical protein